MSWIEGLFIQKQITIHLLFDLNGGLLLGRRNFLSTASVHKVFFRQKKKGYFLGEDIPLAFFMTPLLGDRQPGE